MLVKSVLFRSLSNVFESCSDQQNPGHHATWTLGNRVYNVVH